MDIYSAPDNTSKGLNLNIFNQSITNLKFIILELNLVKLTDEFRCHQNFEQMKWADC